jgi:phytoene desaturase
MGSAFSVEPLLTQSAWFRPHNRDDKIPNLYIVGAGTHPGAGVPGVVGSAKATAGLIIADFPAIAVERTGSAKEGRA